MNHEEFGELTEEQGEQSQALMRQIMTLVGQAGTGGLANQQAAIAGLAQAVGAVAGCAFCPKCQPGFLRFVVAQAEVVAEAARAQGVGESSDCGMH